MYPFLTSWIVDQASTDWSHAVAWFSALKVNDQISFGGSSAAVIAAVASTISAVAAQRTVRQAKAEHRTEVRPRLLLAPSAHTVRASLSGALFNVRDADGMPMGFKIENKGQGRASDVVISCSIEPDRRARRRIARHHTLSLGRIGQRALAALSGPEEITLAWELPGATMTTSAWPTTQSHRAQLEDLDINEAETVALPEEILRAWVSAVLAARTPIAIRCALTYTSASGERVGADTRISLEPLMRTIEGETLNLCFRAIAQHPVHQLSAEQRRSAADRRRQARAYVADARRRARLLEIRAAAFAHL